MEDEEEEEGRVSLLERVLRGRDNLLSPRRLIFLYQSLAFYQLLACLVMGDHEGWVEQGGSKGKRREDQKIKQISFKFQAVPKMNAREQEETSSKLMRIFIFF